MQFGLLVPLYSKNKKYKGMLMLRVLVVALLLSPISVLAKDTLWMYSIDIDDAIGAGGSVGIHKPVGFMRPKRNSSGSMETVGIIATVGTKGHRLSLSYAERVFVFGMDFRAAHQARESGEEESLMEVGFTFAMVTAYTGFTSLTDEDSSYKGVRIQFLF